MKIKIHLSILLALCLMAAVPENVRASDPLDVEIPFSGTGNFEIRPEEDEDTSDPDTVTANGEGTFHVVVTEPGNYIYLLSEAGMDPAFRIQLYVTSDPDGKLSSSLSITELASGKKVDEIHFPEEEAKTETKVENPAKNTAAATPASRRASTVRTGDSTRIIPIICAIAGSSLLLIILLSRKHRASKGEDCL